MDEQKKQIEEKPKDAKIQRRFKGEVVSDAMEKTIVVVIGHLRLHPIYKKRVKTSKKYKVHDPKNQYKVGDIVEFVGCRPMSKGKKWRVIYKK